MTNNKIITRLRLAMKQSGINQAKLAKSVGITPQAVGRWFKNNVIGKDSLVLAAKATGVSVGWLLSGEGEESLNNHSVIRNIQASSIPLISWVSAGAFCESGDSSHLGSAEDYYPGSTKYSSSTFALKIKGLSMYPKFSPGDVIYIDPEREAVNGSYVIIQQNNDSETTFKQLKIIGDQKYLQAINQNIPDIPALIEMMPDASICGVVVARYEELI